MPKSRTFNILGRFINEKSDTMKPKHLSKDYGDQFQDQSIVDRYHKRPAYTDSVIEALLSDLPAHAQILDIGCGTGEISIPLAERGYDVTGVDPSRAMIQRAMSFNQQVNWQCAYAEDFVIIDKVDLIVTANSLHWMDWPIVFPKFARALKEQGRMAIITGGDLTGFEGEHDVMELVREYSTNQDFQPFSLINLLTDGHYFRITQAIKTVPCSYTQTIEDYVQSIHARNGFSIERMGEQRAREFDEKVTAVLREYSDLSVTGILQSMITFGCPLLKTAK